ncbi:hypothetical protein [Rhizobium sp. RU35A]|uniref:hypothetical protein n=1 Tax=Rhizobium sp. RU35A TaxID=1907414 RepID=UPI00122CFA0E|nr:hypothetical protein [Rhizobium sp. RU35A]
MLPILFMPLVGNRLAAGHHALSTKLVLVNVVIAAVSVNTAKGRGWLPAAFGGEWRKLRLLTRAVLFS